MRQSHLLTAAEAIVAALFQAERSGQGQRVEVSMLDAALSFLHDTMNNFTFLEPDVEQVPYLDHSIFLHQTKDGWIATMPVQNAEFLATFLTPDHAPVEIQDRGSNFPRTSPYRLRELGMSTLFIGTNNTFEQRMFPTLLLTIAMTSSMIPR